MNSYSKEKQDVFVQILNPHVGYFLDIGASHPVTGNNTYALEQAGWSGILIDSDSNSVALSNRLRTNKTIHHDATKIDWLKLLSEYSVPKIIDYISLDVDSAGAVVLENFPFDIYQFKIMTFEHDRYNGRNDLKEKSKNILNKYRWIHCMVDNVCFDKEASKPWEDWYINKLYFSQTFIDNNTKENIYYQTYIENLQP